VYERLVLSKKTEIKRFEIKILRRMNIWKYKGMTRQFKKLHNGEHIVYALHLIFLG
jgi:hypothetical protein